MKDEKPESKGCYELHLFGESKCCPELDESIALHPECKKYGKELSWNRWGWILKCAECLGGAKI